MGDKRILHAWQDILKTPLPGLHLAQTYPDESFLVKAVGLYASSGLQAGDGVFLAATKTHLKAFYDEVETLGHNVEALRESGRLYGLAAEEALADIMNDRLPDAPTFFRLAKRSIDQVRLKSKNGQLRIYGELVNVLWLAGNLDGAMAIEKLWDELAKTHAFTLFCGYSMDSLDRSICSGPMQSVSRVHSHVIPAQDYDRLENAVLMGSRDVLGQSGASCVLELAGTAPQTWGEMPAGQKLLLWLSDNMPATAEKIFSRSKNYYQQAAI